MGQRVVGAHKAPVKNPMIVLVNGDRIAGVTVPLLPGTGPLRSAQ
jgi:hypothetical protein